MREVEFQLENAQTAAIALGHRPVVVRASDDGTLNAAFVEIGQIRAGALLVAASPFFMTRAKELVEQAARLALPAMYWRREVVEAGGLMMYGSDTFEMYHQTGVYVGRILKGENPGDLPVWQPTKFDFVLNLRTAKVLGLKIPEKMLALADEVIE